ncbi:MAG: 30S ribosomal protein S6 [Candidatus Omnitrophica bacterium]|nr:30S ribosomal protein S6 [Candidatus Omnitrophota bacterium]MCM8831136.1 30S ribosomal protein S6 [Candidatus Omnitrophota bacterium]
MERKYESALILQSGLAEETQKEILQKIAKKIENLNGKLISEQLWLKEKDFCYSIRSRGAVKKKYFKGNYWLMQFVLDTSKLNEIKETIRLEDRILRSLIIRKEEDI